MNTTSIIDKLGGIGSSEISKLFTREGVKAKTARTLAIEKAEELVNGFTEGFSTAATEHGQFNEEEAFHRVIKPHYPHAQLRSAESIPIGSGYWSTPDVTDDVEGITADIKCPYEIRTFKENCSRVKDAYLAQNQMQMMATGHKRGFILFYLTNNKIDDWGNKIEYDIPIDGRHLFVPTIADEDFHKLIETRISEFFKVRDLIYNDIRDCVDYDDLSFFNLYETHKVTRLKDKSNPTTWKGKIIRHDQTHYVIEKAA